MKKLFLFALAFCFLSSTAFAFRVWSWDLDYYCDCHWQETPAEESAGRFVCTDWKKAKVVVDNPSGGVKNTDAKAVTTKNLRTKVAAAPKPLGRVDPKKIPAEYRKYFPKEAPSAKSKRKE